MTKPDTIPQQSHEYPSPDDTRCVLMTDVNDDGDNVMIYTTLTAEEIEKIFRPVRSFNECYEVPAKDCQFYCYEPCMLTVAEEAEGRRRLAKAS